MEAAPSFRQAFHFWLKLGLISFGGPTGQIAIMQTELVDRRRWIAQDHFLHSLNYCMLLPGPEAQQLAIYCGWLLHRTAGGVVAGVLFVLPSMVILWALSFLYAAYGALPWVSALFFGLKPVVVAIVAVALLRISRRALVQTWRWLIALAAFVAIYFFHVPFPAIIFGAGLIGFLIGKRSPPAKAKPPVDEVHLPSGQTERWRGLRVAAVCLLLWWVPVLLAALFLGRDSSIYREGIFFSKAAVVTFGGAYAVLPYVAQRAVDHFAWLQPGQMVDGLGLAETTPGPLIMVLQFVGFMGGWNQPGQLPQLLAATLGALITTWVTFTPCFLWVLVGAPHLERLRERRALTDTLSGITAAVVGVIANLALWFALKVFHPAPGKIDFFALGLALVALFCLLRWKINVILIVLGGGLAGLVGWLVSR